MNHEIKSTVDEMLAFLISTEALKLYARWKREYKDRMLDSLRDIRTEPPSPNTDNPGFEMNLVQLLCNHLNDYDPHCEWPYASYVKGSKQHVDIQIVRCIRGSKIEFWIEIGMYASQEDTKYRTDFCKLINLLNAGINVVGVMVHVEIFPKDVVLPLFRSFTDHLPNNIDMDVSTLRDGIGPFVCRAIMLKRGAKPSAGS